MVRQLGSMLGATKERHWDRRWETDSEYLTVQWMGILMV